MMSAHARSANVARKAKDAADVIVMKDSAADAKVVTPYSKRVRQEKALGALLSNHLDRAAKGGGEAGLTGRLATQWTAVCPMLAAYCWPVRLQKGVLTIAVTSDPVRQELHYLAPTLMEAANMLAGYGAVRGLRYERRTDAQSLGQTTALPAGRHGGAVLPPRAPTVQAMDSAAGACKGVADDDLKAALARLGAWLF